MSHVFFRKELEGVATFWRVLRRDGVTLGFTGHDRDLYFDGVIHRAAPGMVPSAIRRTADLTPDSAEVQGVLSHSSIRADDLSAGRFDKAKVIVGAVDWETLDRAVLYEGSLGAITQESTSFTAELRSNKTQLDIDYIPWTSPTCRAQFCGLGCTLSVPKFSIEAQVLAIDFDTSSVSFSGVNSQLFVNGELRWLDGPQAGLRSEVIANETSGLVLDTTISPDLAIGTRAMLIEGCDHLLTTCNSRFGNAVNFQGEPFLPGNDLLARYPLPQ